MEFAREIIEELLMRLPVKTMMKFKCVSKDWNDLISDSSFRRRYQSQQSSMGNAPTGFICHDHIIDKMDTLYYQRAFYDRGNEFLYTSKNYIEKEELKNLNYLNKIGFVMAASKGLLLLCRSSKSFSVFDLVSKNSFHLPENHNVKEFVCLGFNCEEKSIKDGNYDHRRLCYKVVCVPVEKVQTVRQSYNVEVYLSETGTWETKIMQTKSNFFIRPHCAAKVIGEVFHWHEYGFNHIIAYDSEDPKGHTILIEYPCGNFRRSERYTTFEGTKDGSLLFIGMEEMTINILIMEIKDGRSYMNYEDKVYANMWNFAYKVSPGDICGGISSFHHPSRIIGVDPVDHHIVYVEIKNQIYAYNYYKKIALFASSQKIDPRALVYVPFKWPTFPCL